MTTEIVFWDVQHGHASYIKTPNNRHIAIDLGVGTRDNETFSPLLHLKKKHKVQQLDYVIITHPHRDHIDDILNFDELSPKVLNRPKHLSKEEVMKDVREQDILKFKKYFEINERYNMPINENSPNNASNPNNWGGLKIQVFASSEPSTTNINNHSSITVISYAEIKIIFTGDNEAPSFNELLKNQNFVSAIKDADVLLAPHHGRESGYHNDFVGLVNPRLTVISDSHFKETSATSKYSAKSRGWTVYKRNGNKEERKSISTRKDGVIVVKCGYTTENKPFLNVTID